MEKVDVNKLVRSSFVNVLMERSHLSPEIFKTMVLFYWNDDATFEKVAKKLEIQRPGAWKRWKRGVDAIMRSFYTLELALYSGILDTDIAEFLSADLQDYVLLTQGKGNIRELQSQIERRMVELAKITSRKRR